MNDTTRFAMIETRQRRSRVRDFLFALGIVVAAAVALTSVQAACHAATPATHVAHR